jgi:hypothetical protein
LTELGRMVCRYQKNPIVFKAHCFI